MLPQRKVLHLAQETEFEPEAALLQWPQSSDVSEKMRAVPVTVMLMVISNSGKIKTRFSAQMAASNTTLGYLRPSESRIQGVGLLLLRCG